MKNNRWDIWVTNGVGTPRRIVCEKLEAYRTIFFSVQKQEALDLADSLRKLAETLKR